jgi:hypothetical protein
MRVLIPALIFLLAVTGCDNRHPLSDKERRDDYGDCSIPRGVPFCCIYVGLDTNEARLFDTNFWLFANQHGIHRPTKHYTIYSGPGVFNGISDHVAIYEYCSKTEDIVAHQAQFPRISMKEAVIEEAAASWALQTDNFLPTNASLITKDGHEVLAPLTGQIKMAPHDTNYSQLDFKRLAETLTNALQSEFPDRVVRVVSYYGDTK